MQLMDAPGAVTISPEEKPKVLGPTTLLSEMEYISDAPVTVELIASHIHDRPKEKCSRNRKQVL